jgi:serine-type D-Ala-D-Ala carboxypeptidase (penicillin-binding protein 5/6)
MRFTGASRFMLALLFLLAAIPLTITASSAQDLVATPEVSAQSAYAFDATSGRELVNLNSEERRAPASTVKIVTAMVVLDHADLETELVFQEADTATEEESRMGLVAGDTVTVDQLITGLLLPSGNDAARTLARHVGTLLGDEVDPIGRFVAEMNAKVAEAGLSNTNFTSPDGLSGDENQYTTAFDLAHLGAMAMTYDKIEKTVSQYRATVTSIGPEARVYELKNTNLLLETADDSEYATDGVIGLKSGSTEQAGACLVLAKRQRGGNLVIGVVLGSELAYDEATGLIANDGRWADMQAIIGSIDDEFAWLNPESMRDVPGLLDELSAWQVGLEDDSSIVVARDLAENIRYQLELTGLASAGDTAGRVLFFAGSDLIDERPLVAR